jgi:hypothetical protein
MEELERSDHRPLRLDCDNARAQPAKRGHTIADMRADVEHQISRPDEAAIESIHRGSPSFVSVIDTK